VLNLQMNRVKVKKARQAAVAYADDITWMAKSKKKMQKIIQISQRFFRFNDIQINSSKSKLLVVNSNTGGNANSVLINNFQLQVEEKYALMRMLGVWLSIEANENLVIKKARRIIQQFIRSIRFKKLTISQLIYINNIYIIPKLTYMLQTTKASKRKLICLHQPIIRLIKNKVGLASTTENSAIMHQGLERCRILS